MHRQRVAVLSPGLPGSLMSCRTRVLRGPRNSLGITERHREVAVELREKGGVAPALQGAPPVDADAPQDARLPPADLGFEALRVFLHLAEVQIPKQLPPVLVGFSIRLALAKTSEQILCHQRQCLLVLCDRGNYGERRSTAAYSRSQIRNAPVRSKEGQH